MSFINGFERRMERLDRWDKVRNRTIIVALVAAAYIWAYLHQL